MKCGLHTHTHKHTLSLGGTHKGLILSKLQLFCLLLLLLLFFTQVQGFIQDFCLWGGKRHMRKCNFNVYVRCFLLNPFVPDLYREVIDLEYLRTLFFFG